MHHSPHPPLQNGEGIMNFRKMSLGEGSEKFDFGGVLNYGANITGGSILVFNNF